MSERLMKEDKKRRFEDDKPDENDSMGSRSSGPGLGENQRKNIPVLHPEQEGEEVIDAEYVDVDASKE